MQAMVELTEQEYEALKSHVKKAATIDKYISVTPGFMRLSICDRILGKLYLALEIQRAPEEEGQERKIEG